MNTTPTPSEPDEVDSPGLRSIFSRLSSDQEDRMSTLGARRNLRLSSRGSSLALATALALGLDDIDSIVTDHDDDIDYEKLEQVLVNRLDCINRGATALVPDGQQREGQAAGTRSEICGAETNSGDTQYVREDNRMDKGNSVFLLEKGNCEVECMDDGNLCRALGVDNFSSVRARKGVTSGKWMFEVQLNTSGVMQIGWTTLLTIFTSEDGVGDSRDSYAFDGKRVRKWNVSSQHYGERWTAGDVISCTIDLDEGNVGFWRNGKHMGLAFSNIRRRDDLEYFPGVSLSYAEGCEINLGSRPFRYQIEGFHPIIPNPSIELRKSCQFLVGCFVDVVRFSDFEQKPSPESAAAHAAKIASRFLTPFDECADAIPDQMKILRSMDSTRYELDEATQEVQTKVAAILIKLLKRYHEQLPYVVESSIVPILKALLDHYKDERIFDNAITVISRVIDETFASGIINHIAMYVGRVVKGNIWVKKDFPMCKAIEMLQFWEACIRNSWFMEVWIDTCPWKEQLEDILFVRQPTNKDLEHLMPFPDGQDLEDIIQDLMCQEVKSDQVICTVSDLILCLRHLEDIHANILQLLLRAEDKKYVMQRKEETYNLEDVGDIIEAFLDKYEADQVTVLPRSEWLGQVMRRLSPCDEDVPSAFRAFVNYLRIKNAGARRDIPPPGLSNRSVLASLSSFILRSLRPFLHRVHLHCDKFDFPSWAFTRGINKILLEETNDGSLQVDGRLGGNLSYIMKRSLVNICEKRAWNIHVPDTGTGLIEWSSMLIERPENVSVEEPKWSWWLLDSLFAMFYMGAGPLIKLNYTYMQTFEAALGSYKALEERAAMETEPASTEFLKFSLRECKKTMVESLRQCMWHLTWLMPSWKQETFAASAATMSRIITSVAELDLPLISYVPDLYIDGTLEMMLGCRRSDQRAWADSQTANLFYLDYVLDMCMKIGCDERVLSPEIQGTILHTIWVLLNDDDTCEFISESESPREKLLPCLIHALAHPRNWIHASNAFGLLVQTGGMTPRVAVESMLSEDLLSCRKRIRGWLRDNLSSDEKIKTLLFSTLIEKITWIAPELISLMEELHRPIDATRLESDDRSMHYRRTMAACDLCYHLLRLLELACQSASRWLLLSRPDQELIRTRLAELLAWGLRTFGPNSHLNKLVHEIHSQTNGSVSRFGKDVRPSMTLEMLGPYLGILVSLEHTVVVAKLKENDEGEGLSERRQHAEICGVWNSFLRILYDFSLSPDVLKDCLDCLSDSEKSGLHHPHEDDSGSINAIISSLSRKDWKTTNEKKDASSTRGLLHQASFSNLAIPEEFLDPILNVPMLDPVILPDSRVTLDRKTIQRHLSISSTDPFSRRELKEEDLIPNVEMQSRLFQFLRKEGLQEDCLPSHDAAPSQQGNTTDLP